MLFAGLGFSYQVLLAKKAILWKHFCSCFHKCLLDDHLVNVGWKLWSSYWHDLVLWFTKLHQLLFCILSKWWILVSEAIFVWSFGTWVRIGWDKGHKEFWELVSIDGPRFLSIICIVIYLFFNAVTTTVVLLEVLHLQRVWRGIKACVWVINQFVLGLYV